MILDLIVGGCWLCPCGKAIRPQRGGNRLVTEHRLQCSFSNRMGNKAIMAGWVTGLTIQGSDGSRRVRW